jgi:hypothetical protein
MTEVDCYHDNLNVRNFADLGEEALPLMVDRYGDYLQRTDIMPRARLTGNRVLDHLLFEYAYRDGVYDEFLKTKVEDEICGAA